MEQFSDTMMNCKCIKAKVEITSKTNVKPFTPTPDHLRIYDLSILDQLNPHEYTSAVYFYPSNDPSTEAVLGRRKILKKSLSRILSQFYPFAGNIQKDGIHIECNDGGVYYLEARVSDQICNFLSHPKGDQIDRLFPFHPINSEDLLMAQTYVVMVQVSIFDCGGIAIGMQSTHKVVDGYTHSTFLKAWADQARGSIWADRICPDLYTGPSLFPHDPTLPKDVSTLMYPDIIDNGRINLTRRFLFTASSLVALKAKINAACGLSNQSRGVSRVTAAIGLIWKCALDASHTILGYRKPSFLAIPVNLRTKKTSPPMSPYSIGNIYWDAYAHLMPKNSALIELDNVIKSLKDGLASFDGDSFVKQMQEDERSANVLNMLKESRRKNIDAEYFLASSLFNGGLYEADFGWGKPLWAALGGTDVITPSNNNLIFLMDTRSGDGIEAWVILDEPNMKLMEKDPELLEFASLDPTPLQIGKPYVHPCKF